MRVVLRGLKCDAFMWQARENRSTTGFDALAYGAANADLNTAFGKNVAVLTEHYIDFGYFEQRRLGTPAASGAEMLIG